MHTTYFTTARLALAVLTLLVVSADIVAQADEVTISRQQIVDRTCEKMRLSSLLERRLDTVRAEALLESLRTEAALAAQEVLPDSLQGSSKEAAAEVLNAGLLIMDERLEYGRLLVRKHLMETRLGLAFQRMQPAPSAEDARTLAKNVGDLFDGMAQSMVVQLAQYYSPEEVSGHLDKLKAALLKKIPNTNTNAAKIPLAQSAVLEILGEFDRRLALSVGRIPARLDVIEHADDPDKANELEQGIKQAILAEITCRPIAMFLNRTSDPTLDAVDPETIVPGYRRVLKDIALFEEAL